MFPTQGRILLVKHESSNFIADFQNSNTFHINVI